MSESLVFRKFFPAKNLHRIEDPEQTPLEIQLVSKSELVLESIDPTLLIDPEDMEEDIQGDIQTVNGTSQIRPKPRETRSDNSNTEIVNRITGILNWGVEEAQDVLLEGVDGSPESSSVATSSGGFLTGEMSKHDRSPHSRHSFSSSTVQLQFSKSSSELHDPFSKKCAEMYSENEGLKTRIQQLFETSSDEYYGPFIEQVRETENLKQKVGELNWELATMNTKTAKPATEAQLTTETEILGRIKSFEGENTQLKQEIQLMETELREQSESKRKVARNSLDNSSIKQIDSECLLKNIQLRLSALQQESSSLQQQYTSVPATKTAPNQAKKISLELSLSLVSSRISSLQRQLSRCFPS